MKQIYLGKDFFELVIGLANFESRLISLTYKGLNIRFDKSNLDLLFKDYKGQFEHIEQRTLKKQVHTEADLIAYAEIIAGMMIGGRERIGQVFDRLTFLELNDNEKEFIKSLI